MRWFFLFSLAATSQALLANTPPRVPPDPAALTAANALVAEMRLEEQVAREYALKAMVIEGVTRSAGEWLSYVHPGQASDVRKRIFVAKVKEEAARSLPPVVPRVKDQLATNFAYRLKVSDLEAAARFLSTPSGRAYFDATVENDSSITSLITREVTTAIPLEALFVSSGDTEQLLTKINR